MSRINKQLLLTIAANLVFLATLGAYIAAQPETLPAPPPELFSRVRAAVDGDTVKLDGGRRIRLYGIDAPESKQHFGKPARELTAALCLDEEVRVVLHGRDRYGREIGTVYVGTVNINHVLLKAGLAHWYRRYSPDDAKLKELETAARQGKVGLWAQRIIEYPEDFRRRTK